MNLEEQSIRLIKTLHDSRKRNIIAFSGGKDSIVLWHLAMKSELPFAYVYSNTTIDPPGHIGFIRHSYPNVKIAQPKYSFYELIEKYGLPTRINRFCCSHLKEYVGKGAKVFLGIRLGESSARMMKYGQLKEPEVCDKKVKGKIRVFPILQWKATDIWKYIHENNLPYPKTYDLGFQRLGCIGCPYATQQERIREYKLYPRYAYAVIKAIRKNIESGGSIGKKFDDPYEAFHWWISNYSIVKYKAYNQMSLIKMNYEEEFKSMFPLKSLNICTQ